MEEKGASIVSLEKVGMTYPNGTEALKEFDLHVDALTDDEREIILKGCLINYYRG